MHQHVIDPVKKNPALSQKGDFRFIDDLDGGRQCRSDRSGFSSNVQLEDIIKIRPRYTRIRRRIRRKIRQDNGVGYETLDDTKIRPSIVRIPPKIPTGVHTSKIHARYRPSGSVI